MVEWKKLGEVCEIGTGSNNREDACDNGCYPFYVRSQEILKIDSYSYDEEAILIPGEGGIGDIFHYINGKYGLHQRTYRVHPITDDVKGRYIYYFLFANFKTYINAKSYKSTAASIRKPMLLDFPIIIPSLSEQTRIVGILDTFTSAIDNLKEQIAQRRKQYEYYRDQLLDLEGKPRVEMKKLGEIVVFRNGKGHEKIIIPDGKYIVVNSKFISSDGSVKKYCNEQISPLYVDDILMVMSDVPNGKAIAKCYLVERNNLYTLNQRIGAFHVCDSNVITKYLFYVINRNEQLLQYDNKIDQTNLKKDDILSITIPLPPLQEQQRIVSILDTFEASIQNLESQLKQREKQYEYYRNKLLTFE